jgi:hypothetical protein
MMPGIAMHPEFIEVLAMWGGDSKVRTLVRYLRWNSLIGLTHYLPGRGFNARLMADGRVRMRTGQIPFDQWAA